jgi:hypothetical protein
MNQLQRSTQPQPFVDRDWELEAVNYRLGILRSGGSVFQCVINFYGIPGIGKTRLLEEIQGRAEAIPTALTDLAAFRDGHRAGPEILADQMRQLERRTHLSDAGFQQALKAFRAHPIPDDPYDEAAWYRFRQKAKEVADAFSVYVYRYARQPKQPVMLLFDNSESATGETFDWLEYEDFGPLVQTGRILLVIAGRSPVRWKRFEVRRRVLLRKLNPPQDGRLLEKHKASWAPVAPKVVQITFNYPPANEAIVTELERAQIVDQETFNQYRPALIQRLMAGVIEENLLTGVDTDLRLAWRIAAPLRQFDVTTLRRVLPEFEPEFEGRGGNYYLLMLNRMVDTSLVEWSAVRKAYVLDNTLRQFLDLDLETRDPDLARRIHERATELYHHWLEEVPENRSAYLVEWLYHQAQRQRLAGLEPPEIVACLRQTLQPVLEQFYQPISVEDDRLLDGARQLLEELERDPDLPDLLGKEDMAKWMAEIKKAIPALKT